jgi:hypothetical protein
VLAGVDQGGDGCCGGRLVASSRTAGCHLPVTRQALPHSAHALRTRRSRLAGRREY